MKSPLFPLFLFVAALIGIISISANLISLIAKVLIFAFTDLDKNIECLLSNLFAHQHPAT